MKNLKKDKLDIRIYDTRKEMGTAAAADIETAVCEILKTKDCCNMIFAAAHPRTSTGSAGSFGED